MCDLCAKQCQPRTKTQPRGADSWDTALEDPEVDFTEVKPYRGYKYLFVVVCTYSGWAKANPTHTERAWEVAKALLLLLLSQFSRVRLCVTPSLGFSRQEHWSGLPFPSPMHKSEKWNWSRSVMPDSSWPHGLQPTRLLHPWGFPGKSTGVGCHCLLRPRPF